MVLSAVSRWDWIKFRKEAPLRLKQESMVQILSANNNYSQLPPRNVTLTNYEQAHLWEPYSNTKSCDVREISARFAQLLIVEDPK